MTRKVTPEHKARAARLPNPNPNRDVDVIDAYEPTPPPRCRVLVEGKPCGKRIYEGGSGAWYHTDNSDNHYAYLERRVSGERRKHENVIMHRRLDCTDNRIADRRKAGKL